MILKKTIASLSICMVGLTLNAENIEVKQGWNLFGAPSAIELNKFDNSCVDYILKYNTDTDTKLGWQHYIANGEYYNYEGTEISSLKEGDGFWVMASSDCSVKINDFLTPPEGSPSIIKDSFSIEENTKDIGFLTSSLTDVTYKIVGGDDHIFFNLEPSSGMLEFKELRNYETQDNFKQDNTYNLEVSVTSNTDALLTTRKFIKVSVTNQEDKFRFYDVSFTNMRNYFGKDFLYTPKFMDAVGTVSIYAKVTNSNNEIIKEVSGASELSFNTPEEYENILFIYNVEMKATDESGSVLSLNFPIYRIGDGSLAKIYTIALDPINIEHNKLTHIPLSGEAKSDTETFPNVYLTYEIITAPTHGTLKKHIDGTWWYRPNAGYSGSDSFTYQASSGTGIELPDKDVGQTVTLNIQEKAN